MMIGECISKQKWNVIILAGGKGSRMGLTSEHLPKALVPLGNQRAIDWIIQRHLGIADRFIIGIGTHGDLLKNYLSGRYPGIDIVFSEEKEPINNAISTLYALDNADSRLPTLITFCDLLILDQVVIEPDCAFYVNQDTSGHLGTFRHYVGFDEESNIFEIATAEEVSEMRNFRELKYEWPLGGLLGYFTFQDTRLLKSIAYNPSEGLNDLTDDMVIPYFETVGKMKSIHCKKVFEFGTSEDLEVVRKLWESKI